MKLNKSKNIILIYIILILLITMASCSTKIENDSNSIILPDSNTAKPQEENLQQLDGIIIDATMNTITVKDNSGNIYSFTKDPSKLEQGKSGVLIDNPITILYYGDLNNTQNVKIEKITVSDIIKDEKYYLEKSKNILENMSLEEKVGQMFIVRCPEDNVEELIAKYNLGGIILFSRDFKDKSKADVINNIEAFQNSSKLKMLIGVDEEGGIVNRVSTFKNFRAVPFWSSQDLYSYGGWDLIISDTEEKSDLLKSLGINLNLSPVCDISTDPSDYIYSRSFGKDAKLTSEYIKTVVSTMNDKGIGCTLKHFPGYGNNVDTHTGIAYDKRNYDTFINNDFLPFQAGIEEGAGSVLVSHNIVECMDSEYPASLSNKVHEILRNELNFNGVIMTDDLYMDAIKNYIGKSEAAVTAVLAGNDMICCTDFEIQIPAVIKAVQDGKISEDDINQSVIRILCWKLKLGII